MTEVSCLKHTATELRVVSRSHKKSSMLIQPLHYKAMTLISRCIDRGIISPAVEAFRLLVTGSQPRQLFNYPVTLPRQQVHLYAISVLAHVALFTIIGGGSLPTQPDSSILASATARRFITLSSLRGRNWDNFRSWLLFGCGSENTY